MKRSELKNIVREIVEDAYVDLSKVKVGDTKTDPETGVTSTLSAVNPDTGKLTWDVSYEVDPKQVYDKLDQLVNYMNAAKGNTELSQIKDILKKLKNQTSRLMKKS